MLPTKRNRIRGVLKKNFNPVTPYKLYKLKNNSKIIVYIYCISKVSMYI